MIAIPTNAYPFYRLVETSIRSHARPGYGTPGNTFHTASLKTISHVMRMKSYGQTHKEGEM
jgi:hypothetical protein